MKCAVATWNYKSGGIVHLKSPAFFFFFSTAYLMLGRIKSRLQKNVRAIIKVVVDILACIVVARYGFRLQKKKCM